MAEAGWTGSAGRSCEGGSEKMLMTVGKTEALILQLMSRLDAAETNQTNAQQRRRGRRGEGQGHRQYGKY